MRKIVSLMLVAVVVLGIVGLAQTPVVPREYGVFLFDNESGAAAAKIGIQFDKAVEIATSDIIAFGGGAVKLLSVVQNYVWIEVEVVSGGTLQVTLRGDSADAAVGSAYWFD